MIENSREKGGKVKRKYSKQTVVEAVPGKTPVEQFNKTFLIQFDVTALQSQFNSSQSHVSDKFAVFNSLYSF